MSNTSGAVEYGVKMGIFTASAISVFSLFSNQNVPLHSVVAVGLGTGLGLSVSRSIISKLGGNIDLVSAEKKGTTFTVRLPVVMVQ